VRVNNGSWGRYIKALTLRGLVALAGSRTISVSKSTRQVFGGTVLPTLFVQPPGFSATALPNAANSSFSIWNHTELAYPTSVQTPTTNYLVGPDPTMRVSLLRSTVDYQLVWYNYKIYEIRTHKLFHVTLNMSTCAFSIQFHSSPTAVQPRSQGWTLGTCHLSRSVQSLGLMVSPGLSGHDGVAASWSALRTLRVVVFLATLGLLGLHWSPLTRQGVALFGAKVSVSVSSSRILSPIHPRVRGSRRIHNGLKLKLVGACHRSQRQTCSLERPPQARRRVRGPGSDDDPQARGARAAARFSLCRCSTPPTAARPSPHPSSVLADTVADDGHESIQQPEDPRHHGDVGRQEPRATPHGPERQRGRRVYPDDIHVRSLRCVCCV
jgi:hypothetical protein